MGLRTRDIIVGINGKPFGLEVAPATQFNRLQEARQRVLLSVRRNGTTVKIEADFSQFQGQELRAGGHLEPFIH